MDYPTVIMGDPTVALLLSIPDTDAMAFNPANAVRRSMRNVRPRVSPSDMVADPVPEEHNVAKAQEPTATGVKASSSKRQRSLINKSIDPTITDTPQEIEKSTSVDAENANVESPLKKVKLAEPEQLNSALASTGVEIDENSSNKGEPDEDFIPDERKTSGSQQEMQPPSKIVFPATPPFSEGTLTPSPKKLVVLDLNRGNRARRAPTKTANSSLAKSPKATPQQAIPSVDTLTRLPPYGKPLVWAEVSSIDVTCYSIMVTNSS